MRCVAPGYYVTTAVRKYDGKKVELSTTRQDGLKNWYWQMDGGPAEDLFPSQAAAAAAGREFLATCVPHPEYGWVGV